MNITKFNEKFNRVEGNIYTVEEVVTPIDGVYEAPLIHDNANNINVYTGSKLTGDKINTCTMSTPSLTPWKTVITIYSNEPKLYITYETTGDQVEAEDINNLQDSVNRTQEELNKEINRATDRENTIESNLNKEIDRAKAKETEITNNLNAEVTRAKASEKVLTDNLNSEIIRAKAKESQIDTELANRYTKDKVYTKEEVLTKIESLINNAPDVLDTFKEIADALGNDPNFATTMTTLLSQKVDKVTGKGLSTNDFTDTYKNNLIDSNNKKHEHSNKSVIDTITSALITNWNSAFTHISDAIKHITSAERTLWNTVSNKAEKTHTHTKSQVTDMPTKLSQFTNDTGFIKQSEIDTSQNHTHSNKTVLDKITQSSLDSWNTVGNKLDKSGGTVTGKTFFNQGTCIREISAGSGTTGYMYIAQIKIGEGYKNQPIIFNIHQRERYGAIIVKFANVNSNDPTLSYINKIGNIEAYIYKSATSTWNLYIKKTEAYDCISIMDFAKSEYMKNVTVTWQDATVGTLPSGYVTASNATIDMNVTNSTKATQDSDGKQINTTYVKKGMTWNDLEGV